MISITMVSGRGSFWFPKKAEVEDNVQLVMDYYQYSHSKALEALEILTDDQLEIMRQKLDKGGRV